MVRIIAVCLVSIFIFGCASAPSRSPGQNQTELTELARRGDQAGIKKYFEEFATESAYEYGSLMVFLYYGNTSTRMTLSKFEQDFQEQNKSVDYVQRCKDEKEGVQRLKCLTRLPAPCVLSKTSDVTYCSIVEEVEPWTFFGKFKLINPTNLQRVGELTSDTNLKWYLSELKKNFDIANVQVDAELAKLKGQNSLQKTEEKKWIQFCQRTKRKVISKASIVPISKFGSNSFWSEVQGLNLAPHCLKDSDEVGKYYGICRHDSHRGCAVVEGLPSGSNSNSSIAEYLSFVGYTKGNDMSGINVKEIPVWKIVPLDELKKAGLAVD